jgi:ubiquinone/menaquinone biosynthesis C-methylase UbiE
MPNDKLLDLGAGSLRIGWWFLHYIKPENYYAVDPSRERLDVGADLLGVDINRFYNDDWEFPDVKFDFVFARSIWTHASKWMISKTLSEFVENSSPKGRLLTSVILAESDAEDYKGSEWIPLAVIKHSMDWIQSECEKNGLDVTRVGGNLYSQTWLLITKAK